MPPKSNLGKRKREAETSDTKASPNTSESSESAASPSLPQSKTEKGPKVVTVNESMLTVQLEFSDEHKKMLKNVGEEVPAFYVYLNPTNLAGVVASVNSRAPLGGGSHVFNGDNVNPVANADSIEQDIVGYLTTLQAGRVQGSDGTLIAPNTMAEYSQLVVNAWNLCFEPEVITLGIQPVNLPLGHLNLISNSRTFQPVGFAMGTRPPPGIQLWR